MRLATPLPPGSISSTSPRCRAAGIFRRSNSRICGSMTFARFSMKRPLQRIADVAEEARRGRGRRHLAKRFDDEAAGAVAGMLAADAVGDRPEPDLAAVDAGILVGRADCYQNCYVDVNIRLRGGPGDDSAPMKPVCGANSAIRRPRLWRSWQDAAT